MDIKKNWKDVAIIVSVIVVILILLLTIKPKSDSNMAFIYIKGELVDSICLDYNDTTLEYDEFIIELKDHKIGVKSSSCPHQDCVKMGYTNQVDKPIVCAYYNLIITIGEKDFDWVV